MSHIFIIMLISLLFLGLVMVGSLFYVNYLVRFYVTRKHSLLEEITSTGNVPRAWSEKNTQKVTSLRSEGKFQESAAAERQAQYGYVKKLDKLIAYAKKTNLVQDEETRLALLQELSDVKLRWEETNVDEFNHTRS